MPRASQTADALSRRLAAGARRGGQVGNGCPICDGTHHPMARSPAAC